MNFYFIQVSLTFALLLTAACEDVGTDKMTANEDDKISASPTASTPSITTAKPKMPAESNATPVTSRFNFPSCAELNAKNMSEEDLIAHLEKNFPPELIGVETVEQADLNSDELTRLTGYAACIASLTPGPDAPESALALFASKRHGAAAMAALKAQAQGNSIAAKAANGFVAQMTAFLQGPGE